MELRDSTTEEFKQNGLNLIEKFGEVLVKIRFPYQAGNKGFFMIKSEKEFIAFLNNRETKESITIYTVIEKKAEGFITNEFVNNTLSQLIKPKYSDWLIILPQIKPDSENSHYDDTKEELEDTLKLCFGQYIQILEDPDFGGEDSIIHAYVPDEDGIVRPGVY
jgi:hypothetical protein